MPNVSNFNSKSILLKMYTINNVSVAISLDVWNFNYLVILNTLNIKIYNCSVDRGTNVV